MTLKIRFVDLRYLAVEVGNSPERVIGKERAFSGFSVFVWPNGYHQEGFKGAPERYRGDDVDPVAKKQRYLSNRKNCICVRKEYSSMYFARGIEKKTSGIPAIQSSSFVQQRKNK
ncbi:hypothetical protein CDAR_518181 [Caerostris darwini]|uniref:Uncharacterized protein n=1 Tax=Caerostris darwini TaxID=1538125 RepID=A0AAV4RMZ8_9ARAC|nr:hypothetical protein CDAR_518181 [Caerostris darwini]